MPGIDDLLAMYLPQLQGVTAGAGAIPGQPADYQPQPMPRARLQGAVAPSGATSAPTPALTPTAAPTVAPAAAGAAGSGMFSKIAPYILPLLMGVGSAASPVAARGIGAAANTYLAMQQAKLASQKQQELEDYHKGILASKGGGLHNVSPGQTVLGKGEGGRLQEVYKAPQKPSAMLTRELMPFIPAEKLKNPDSIVTEDLATAQKKYEEHQEAIYGARERGKTTERIQTNINLTGNPWAPKAPSGGGGKGSDGKYWRNPDGSLKLDEQGDPIPAGDKFTPDTAAKTSKEIRSEVNRRMNKSNLSIPEKIRLRKEGDSGLRKEKEEQVRKEFGSSPAAKPGPLDQILFGNKPVAE